MHGIYDEEWSDEIILNQKLSDCYLQGKSTHNIRIERLWLTQGHTTTWLWIEYLDGLSRRKYFDVLQRRELYLFYDHLEVDKVIINYIFMPLIR